MLYLALGFFVGVVVTFLVMLALLGGSNHPNSS